MLLAIIVGGALVGSLALTTISSTSEGPVTGAMNRLGSTFGSFEHAIRGRFQGPGRSADLKWFDGYRNSVARLKQPDRVLLGAFDSAGDRFPQCHMTAAVHNYHSPKQLPGHLNLGRVP